MNSTINVKLPCLVKTLSAALFAVIPPTVTLMKISLQKHENWYHPMIGCFWYLYLYNSFNLLINTLATMKMKSTLTCLRSQPLLNIPLLWPIVELVLGNHTIKPYGCGCKRLLEHKAYKTCHSCVDKDPVIAYNMIRVSCWGDGKCCTVCSDVTCYNCLIAPL